MKINILSKKTIKPEVHPIDFHKDCYLYNNEEHPGIDKYSVIVKKPSNKKAKIKIFESDPYKETLQEDKLFKGLNDYNYVTALHQEKITRGTK